MAVRITLRPAPDPLTTGTHFRIDVGRDVKSADPAKVRYRDRYWADSEEHRDEILAGLRASGERRKIVVTPVPPLDAADGYCFDGTLESAAHLAPAAARPLSKHVVVDVTDAASYRDASDRAIVAALEHNKRRDAARRVVARTTQRTAKARATQRAHLKLATAAASKLRADERKDHEKALAEAISRHREKEPTLPITKVLERLADETDVKLSTWKDRKAAINQDRALRRLPPLK